LSRSNRIAALALVIPLSGCSWGVAGRTPSAETGSIYGAAWSWTTEDGRSVGLATWRGEALVVAPIYASCTERCPRTIDKVREVDQAFARRGVARHVLLVTLDPRSDGLERLRRFKEIRRLPADWTILRGEEDATRELARVLGVRAIYDDTHIDHDVRIAVFDGAGRMVRNFRGWDFDDEDAVVTP
jgi:cytochrome oxidase Cu insertion factor (SCO1/SenC/PrrC family)